MKSRVTRGASLVAAFIALAGACDDAPFSPGDEIRGSWGGEGFGLEVFADSASALFTCAYGTLETPILLGFDHRFVTRGEYVREVGPAALPNPARYEGLVRGSAIELTVVVTDTIGVAGTYTVGPFAGTLGGEPQVYYCQ